MDLPPPPSADMDVTSSLARRLRMLEESHTNTRKKLELTEQNILGDTKKTKAVISDIDHELDDLKKQMRTLKDDVMKIITELQSTAKAEQVQTLQKYLDLWEPVKFVTANQVRNIVADILASANPTQTTFNQPRAMPMAQTQTSISSTKPKRKDPPALIEEKLPTIADEASKSENEQEQDSETSQESEDIPTSSLPPMPDPSLRKKKGLDELF